MVTESEHRQSEISKSTYEFERDIIRGGVNPVKLNRSNIILHAKHFYHHYDFLRELGKFWEKGLSSFLKITLDQE